MGIVRLLDYLMKVICFREELLAWITEQKNLTLRTAAHLLHQQG